MTSFAECTIADLQHQLQAWQQKPSHAGRILRSYYSRAGNIAWDELRLPAGLRDKLTDHYAPGSTQIVRRHRSADGTIKLLVQLADGHTVESVLMPDHRPDRAAGCISTQVGCAMACTFCATGTMGFTRNLSADEIIDQYRYWMYFLAGRHDLEPRISNVVYMGMGEPLANYENVKASLQAFLAHTDMGPTRLTVSTVGLVPMLRKLLTDVTWPPVRLAVSLHSADAKTRTAIMPSSYPKFLDDLAEWTKEYFLKFESRRRHLTFEYVMLAGVNDTSAHADKLIAFARKVGKVKINLIPYNDTKSRYSTSESSALLDFEQRLNQAKLDVTRRPTMGADIAAACGQLIVEKSTQK